MNYSSQKAEVLCHLLLYTQHPRYRAHGSIHAKLPLPSISALKGQLSEIGANLIILKPRDKLPGSKESMNPF